MLSQRFERLNALAKINSASKYLEIGVNRGETFNLVNIPHKVAVDPQFRFNTLDYQTDTIIFHEVTSDVFFAQLTSQYDKFDLIYLDGLHTFEQTLRDFCASISQSHEKTIWLIDDTCPISQLASMRDETQVKKIRKFFKVKDKRWMGDVFKLVFVIHDFFPQFSYATFPKHGQTAIWFEPRINFTPTWNSLEKISRFKYRDFLKFKDSHLFISEPSQIIESIEKALNNK